MVASIQPRDRRLTGAFVEKPTAPLPLAARFRRASGLTCWAAVSRFPRRLILNSRILTLQAKLGSFTRRSWGSILASAASTPGHAVFINAVALQFWPFPTCSFAFATTIKIISVPRRDDRCQWRISGQTAFYPFGLARHEHRLRQVENYKFAQKERDREAA